MLDFWLRSSYQKFSDAVKLNRIPHSVVIAGAPNLGTAYLAIECAKLYLCHNSKDGNYCENCSSCHYLEYGQSLTHPDFIALLASTADETKDGRDLTNSPDQLLVNMDPSLADSLLGAEGLALLEQEKGSRSVRVEGVRKLCEWVYQSSALSHGKVAIVSNAHTMLESASNAFLKTFEEPPSDTLIILLTKSLEDLPATVLSRAFKIQVPPVDKEQALAYLKDRLKEEYDQNRVRICLALSGNSPVGALNLFKEQLDKSAVTIIRCISDCLNNSSSSKAAVEELLRLSDPQKSLVLQEFILELLKYKARNDVAGLPLLAGQNLDLLSKLPADHLFKAYSDLCYVRADGNMIPSRAPEALLRSWILALSK
ncbi:MAG: hypothetical protein ACI4UM_02625 [Succinivibrio sp.]